MIIHGIDMTKINDPDVHETYDKKMRELIPVKNKWFIDPFGRNLNVKITKRRIEYGGRFKDDGGLQNEEADKNSKKYMRRVEVTV